MKIRIRRVWFDDLTKYKNVLEKYEAVFDENDDAYAVIKINDIADLLNLPKELGKELIIEEDGEIAIFDERIN